MPDATRESKTLHDLSNQFAIILGFCEMLLDGLDANDARRDDIREIIQAVEQAKKIARDAWGTDPPAESKAPAK